MMPFNGATMPAAAEPPPQAFGFGGVQQGGGGVPGWGGIMNTFGNAPGTNPSGGMMPEQFAQQGAMQASGGMSFQQQGQMPQHGSTPGFAEAGGPPGGGQQIGGAGQPFIGAPPVDMPAFGLGQAVPGNQNMNSGQQIMGPPMEMPNFGGQQFMGGPSMEAPAFHSNGMAGAPQQQFSSFNDFQAQGAGNFVQLTGSNFVQSGANGQPGQPGFPGQPPVADGPPCGCGQPSNQRTTRKEGPNLGRVFFCCAKPQGPDQCRYFQWADEPPRDPNQPNGQPGAPGQQLVADGPPCGCGQPSNQRTTRKEGPNCGRVFFCCAKPQGPEQCGYFQWADEPPRDPNQPMAPALPEGPPCFCQQPIPTAQRTAKKVGPNVGRNFYCCAKPQDQQCGYFGWADEAQQVPGPPCQCGIATGMRTVQKEGPNKGRPYSTCSTKKCGFFQFADEEPGQGSNAPANGPPCQCGAPSKSLTVVKEGANKGRPFFGCATRACQFFAWGDEQSAQGPGGFPVATPVRAAFGGGKGYGGGSNMYGGGGMGQNMNGGGPAVCFKCNQPGHFANACPMQGGAGGPSMYGGAAAAPNMYGGGGGYKCGMEGHWASNCPNDGGSNKGTGKGKGGGKGYGKSKAYGAPDNFNEVEVGFGPY